MRYRFKIVHKTIEYKNIMTRIKKKNNSTTLRRYLYVGTRSYVNE